jgi:hypothetical protein
MLQGCCELRPAFQSISALARLCRLPNYAERARFPQDSLRPAVIGAA